MGSLRDMYSPETPPPKNVNLPLDLAPSHTVGGERVKAVIRWGSVNVVKSSAAEVRNSAFTVTGTVLIFWPFVELVVVVVVVVVVVDDDDDDDLAFA